MRLSTEDCYLFYKLHPLLLGYASRKLKALPDDVTAPEAFVSLPQETRLEVREALHAQPELIDQFVKENPANLSTDELNIVSSWRYALVGSFYVFRYLKRYTIFLSSEENPKAHGVLALADSFEELVGSYLPILVKAVLLPFKGTVIYDGLLSSHPISFGGGFKRMLNDTYNRAKADFGIITSLPFGGEEPEPEEETEAIIVTYDRYGGTHETRIGGKKETTTFSLNLTKAQRRIVAGLLPQHESRLHLDNSKAKAIHFTIEEIETIVKECSAAVPDAENGQIRHSLYCIIQTAGKALERQKEGSIFRIPAKDRVYQLRISLKESDPEIWRRIQIKDCSFDRLHRIIQLAMGWENYHLHQFEVGGVLYGDPEMLCNDWEDEPEIVDSHDTRLNKIIPEDGSRFAFKYEYDFGDCWQHELLFEGCLRAKPGARYPICLEGVRACPPEDVGGVRGYETYLQALADPTDEEHEEYLEWRGPFDPEAFDAAKVTRKMRRGR